MERLLELSKSIRYAAVYHSGQLFSQRRGGLSGASSPETDRYKELLVNPAILLLAT